MALSVTSTFAGIASTGIISKALLAGRTLANGHLTIMPNIKYKMPVNRISLGDILQADGCSFNASGTITLDERLLDPCPLKINVEVCKTTLESHWESAKMRAGALNSDFPQDLKSFATDYLSDKVAEQVEKLIWQGDLTGVTINLCDGLLKIAGNDSNTVKQTGTTLSAANIIAEVSKVYDKIPAEIIDNGKVKIFVSQAASRFYKQAIANQSNEAYYVGDKKLDFIGIEIVSTPGMPANRMMAFESENVFFGTDLESDLNEVRIIDMADYEGSDNLRFKMRMQVGVQYAFGTEIVIYG